jgi:hypothetical protein
LEQEEASRFQIVARWLGSAAEDRSDLRTTEQSSAQVAQSTNLLVPFTSFIGQQWEVKEVGSMLRRCASFDPSTALPHRVSVWFPKGQKLSVIAR